MPPYQPASLDDFLVMHPELSGVAEVLIEEPVEPAKPYEDTRWYVLMGKLEDGASARVRKGGRVVPYPLERRETFEWFSRPRGHAEAEAYLSEYPWGGARHIEELLSSQPGLLAGFSGAYEGDANWLAGRAVVGDVSGPGGWGMNIVEGISSAGDRVQAYACTITLLSTLGRVDDASLVAMDGTTYHNGWGEARHDTTEYRRNLLFDLRRLLASGVAYLDVTTTG